jgi:hypothetical protein
MRKIQKDCVRCARTATFHVTDDMAKKLKQRGGVNAYIDKQWRKVCRCP